MTAYIKGVDVAYNHTLCHWGRNGNGVWDLTFLLIGEVAGLYLEAYTGWIGWMLFIGLDGLVYRLWTLLMSSESKAME